METPEIASKLTKLAERYGVGLIYLFGSQVDVGLALLNEEKRPVYDPLSDIDVGIVFEHALPQSKDRAEVYAGIYNSLVDLFSPHTLDLCLLQENHSVFQAGVLHGTCIYAADQSLRESYEEEIARRAADFRPVLEQYLNEVLEEV